jgi:acyl-CoA synthetase (NDP forming)
VLPEVQYHLLIRSDKHRSGYKGVHAKDGRYRAQCTTAPCRFNQLGRFDTPEDAAQAYLQHWETKHPEELEKERAPRPPPPVLPEVQHYLLIRSDKAKTGYKGVTAVNGRCQAECKNTPCHHNYLGIFASPEDAAQAYLQHWEKKNPKELEKERAPPPPPPVLPEVQHHLLIRSDKAKSGYKGVSLRGGRYRASCDTAPCRKNKLGIFDTPEDAAQAYLQHYEKKHPKELEKERAPLPPPPVLPDVQHHLIFRSDKAKSGYKGVTASHSRYNALCNTAPCGNNYLGSFDTPEDAAQAYLQHWEKKHP